MEWTLDQSQPFAVVWEYRWGDSPVTDEGQPLWTLGAGEESDWKSIAFPSNPPRRGEHTNVWFRVRLPEEEPGDTLYIYSIDLIAEVYLDGQIIYNYGEFDSDGRGKFKGWPWHLIHLPTGHAGKYLYFRVYSDHSDIGLWGQVAIGTEASHIKRIVRRDLLPFTIGLASALAGSLLIFFAPLHRRFPVLLMGLFLVMLGFIPIFESQIKQLILFAPVTLQFLSAGNYFLLPACMAALVHALFGPGLWRTHQLIWIIHLVFFTCAMGLAIPSIVNLSAFYLYFDVLALVTMLVLTVALTLAARKHSKNLKYTAIGFWLLYIVMAYNGLTAHGILPFAPRSEYLGPLLVGITFCVVLINRYSTLSLTLEKRTNELVKLNQTLECTIASRTDELQATNQSKNQIFSIIGHDLKAPIATLFHLFKEFEKDKQGIPAEDVPDMRKSCGRVHDLLHNLLIWARGQQGQLTAHKQRVDILALIQTATSTLQTVAAAKHIELEVASNEKIFVRADPEMISTAIRNIVGNAIKFAPIGGHVRVALTQQEGALRFTCEDDGSGIPDSKRDKLFQPKDYTSIGTGTRGERGSGIGLLICHEFIQLHGGKIGYSDAASGGALVWFSIATDSD